MGEAGLADREEVRVPIARDTDVVVACYKGRAVAERMGLSGTEQAGVIIAISEVAHNILRYARQGEIVIAPLSRNGRYGVGIVARDQGPGIPDIEKALQDGYSTGGGLGLGLPGAKRLMDEFEIVSHVGVGTTVTMKKWKRKSGQ